MHILHRILVRVVGNGTREDIIDEARSRAESLTEDFYEQAFDWRVTDSAGRWEEEYPENVILSRENIERFKSELERCLLAQQKEIEYRLENICKTSSDIRELVNLANTGKSTFVYDLRCLAELLYGEYNCDSGFYNTEEYTAKITSSTIDAVKASPNDWALVMFDYHY